MDFKIWIERTQERVRVECIKWMFFSFILKKKKTVSLFFAIQFLRLHFVLLILFFIHFVVLILFYFISFAVLVADFSRHMHGIFTTIFYFLFLLPWHCRVSVTFRVNCQENNIIFHTRYVTCTCLYVYIYTFIFFSTHIILQMQKVMAQVFFFSPFFVSLINWTFIHS